MKMRELEQLDSLYHLGVVLFLCFCGGAFVCFLLGQGSTLTFVALPRSYAKSVDNTGVKKMSGIKVLLTLLISTLTSNISFIQLSSLLSGYPASSFFKSGNFT